MKTYDVVTIGSITQDTYVSCSDVAITKGKKGKLFSFPFGTKIELNEMRMEVGGGATNAAATFSRLGLQTSVVAECGQDPSGEFAVSELNTLGIDTLHIRRQPRGRTAYSVIFLGPKGERTIFVYRGVQTTGTQYLSALKVLDARWLYVTSLGGNTSALAKVFAEKERGISIAWNPGKNELAKGAKKLKPFLDRTDVLLVNKEEVALLFGKDRSSFAGVLVVTDGHRGSQLHTGSTTFRVKVNPVISKDTTGAGDAFGSGFIAGLLKKPGDFPFALRCASANAMSVVQEVGAKHGLLTAISQPALYKRIHIH